MTNKQVMVFGFSEDQQMKIKDISGKFKASFKTIANHMISLTLKEILNDQVTHTDNICNEHSKINNEKVILFNDFEESELKKIIKSIRENKDLGCILAVVTPTSINWTFEYLTNHLIEEREWFLKNQ